LKLLVKYSAYLYNRSLLRRAQSHLLIGGLLMIQTYCEESTTALERKVKELLRRVTPS
jgi:hypothetical protein